MGRYNSNKITTEFVQDYLKNRYWEKHKAEYVPFLNVRSVPTHGYAERVKGWKSGREQHFLSRLELYAFYYFEWCDFIVDIREQYPLLPIEMLQEIAGEAGIEYPNFGGEPIIMTTDFLITCKKDGKIINYARTIKQSEKLNDLRIIEKFEIEKRYFKSKGIDWGIITEKDFSDIFIYNMKILHANKFSGLEFESENMKYTYTLYRELANTIDKINTKNMPITLVLTQLSDYLNLRFSDISDMFYKGIIDRIITTDIKEKKLDINALTLNDIKINIEAINGR